MTGANIVRVFIGLMGVLLFVAGVAVAVAYFGSGGLFGGFWLILGGAALIIGVLVERTRYRSQAAERDQLSPGPGGGETAPPDARFQRTDEVFIDPTSHLQMRVYLDPVTGERRYLAE